LLLSVRHPARSTGTLVSLNALQPFSLRKSVKARPCAPVGNGYLCFKEMSVSFSAFYRLQLSSCGEKECLTVTHAVRFAVCFCFFVSFACGTLLRTPEPLSGIICPPFQL